MYDSEDYKLGYDEGREYGHARLTYDYCHMDYSRKMEFDRGVHDGNEARWREDDEYFRWR